jgi:hypothetical protein
MSEQRQRHLAAVDELQAGPSPTSHPSLHKVFPSSTNPVEDSSTDPNRNVLRTILNGGPTRTAQFNVKFSF